VATKWEINRAVRASSLPAPSRLIMLTLSDIADAGTAEIPERRTPSLSVLAQETGLSRRSVANHLTLLEDGGWITRVRPDVVAARSRGERTCYRLTIPEGADLVQEVHHSETGVVQEMHQGSASPALGSAGDALGLVQEVHHPSAGDAPSNNHDDQNDLKTITDELFELPPVAPPALSKPKKRATKKTDPDADPEFAKFWSAHPHPVAQPETYRLWKDAIKGASVTADQLLDAAVALAHHHFAEQTPLRFIPQSKTWLRDRRWRDPLVSRGGRTNGHQPYRNPEDTSIYEGAL
jgi:DNA-binding transcriptional ArsR family regulator